MHPWGVRIAAGLWNPNDDLAQAMARRSGGRNLASLYALIARNSLWVDPAVARAVPVVFPRTARRHLTRQREGDVVGGIRLWNNVPAAYAFYAALGSNLKHWRNAAVCHIYPRTAFDHRYFTRLANLTAVPRSLWQFTDWNVVEAVLQRRAYELYGWKGPMGIVPAVPPHYPGPWWRGPTYLEDPENVSKGLLKHRAEHPMYREQTATWKGRTVGRRGAEGLLTAEEVRWQSTDEREGAAGILPAVPSLRVPARDLDGEFWEAAKADRRTVPFFVGMLKRHAYFAPVRIVEAVPNPFPRTRRVRPYGGERPRQVVDGITLATNMAAADALTAAIGRGIHMIRGGNVNHAWPGTPQIPAHFCHLGGMVLVPAACSSLVDAPPIRAVLQRRLYERTGYCGPAGHPPPRSTVATAGWPETVRLSREQEDRIIEKLRRFVVERPGYFPPARSSRVGLPERGRGR